MAMSTSVSLRRAVPAYALSSHSQPTLARQGPTRPRTAAARAPRLLWGAGLGASAHAELALTCRAARGYRKEEREWRGPAPGSGRGRGQGRGGRGGRGGRSSRGGGRDDEQDASRDRPRQRREYGGTRRRRDGANNPPGGGGELCPACHIELGKLKTKHLAFCCPDLLDPEGWEAGDSETVRRITMYRHGPNARDWRLLCLRFGWSKDGQSQERDAMMPDEVGERMGMEPDHVTAIVRRELSNIPILPEFEPLDVLYEDDGMLAVCKPPGMGVSPAHRLRTGSLLNRAVAHCRLEPYLVHRLDLETSGVVLLAKTKAAATDLMQQFEHREVTKEYMAICRSEPGTEIPGPEFSSDARIGRVPGEARAMRRVLPEGGQEAHTDFVVLRSSGPEGTAGADEGGTEGGEEPRRRTPRAARAPAEGGAGGDEAGVRYSLVRALPKTGRTHQIRLHLAASGLPIAGDDLYAAGGGPCTPLGPAPGPTGGVVGRMALHASALTVRAPGGTETIRIEAPLPDDMAGVLEALGI